MAGEPLDGVLLDRARAGDPEAFAVLTEPLRGPVFSVLAGMVGRRDAEDLVQDVFVRAFKGLRRFRGDSALRTWMTRIAINLAIRHLRRRKDERPLEDVDYDHLSDDPPDTAARLAVHEAVDKLSPKLRAAIVLFYFEGLSLNETAESLGINRGTAASRLHEARRILRDKLKLTEEPRGGDDR